MSSVNLADYMVGDAKRKELVSRFLDIVTGMSGYYRNFLRENYLAVPYNRAALEALKTPKPGTTAKQAQEAREIVLGATAMPAPKPAEFAAFASWIANRFIPQALGKTTEQPKLEPPIVMIEQVAADNLYFYRVYGGDGKAKSMGNWWMDEADVVDMVQAATRYGARSGWKDWQVKKLTREFMLSSAFVYPEWNDGLRVARMTVPAGMRLPVIVARGSWRTFAEAARPDKALQEAGLPDMASEAKKQKRVLQSGMLPRSGLKQWFLPVFDQKWIKELSNNDPHWPFGREISGI